MDVALVGVVSAQFENQSLAVLQSALGDAGFESYVVPFRGFGGMDAMLADILRMKPRICGVSLQTTESVLAALVFTRLLRARGFTGMTVLGGHVATLCADEILAARAGVDVVVELAGEAALVGLARGHDPLSLPGTRTRRGCGPSPIAVQPRSMRRQSLSDHLGLGAADLILSRGCAANCGCCCVSAISDLAERSGSARNVSRDVDSIADEISEAVDRGARALHFMDDNVLPLDPAEALRWTRALRDSLRSRRTPSIAFSLQLRADVVTPELAGELARLGLVRAYVGIDGYTTGQLRALGRSAPATAGRQAIAALREHGVYCVANALVVGPTIRHETILGEIEGLALIVDAPIHLLPVEARPGTVYHRRATARGLIEGGPLWPVYRFEDPRTFLIAEVITHLPTRLAERSVPIALYDLAWALGVAQRLVPTADVQAAKATYASVTAAWNEDQIRVLRISAEAATRGPLEIEQLIAREQPYVRAHDEALLRACDQALADVERAVSGVSGRPVRAHARGRLLGGLAFAMGLAAACSPGERAHVDAAVADAFVAAPDVAPPPACTDSGRASEWFIDNDRTCECGSAQVRLTFNADGEITEIVGETGQSLSPEVHACLLDLLADYCYPSLAGMTRSFMTCHGWIA